MADLPKQRVTPQSPFQSVWMDFTGAFTVKCNYYRVNKYVKAYAAIFVCFSTRGCAHGDSQFRIYRRFSKCSEKFHSKKRITI